MSTFPDTISQAAQAARAAALRACPLFTALSAQDLEKIAGFSSLKRVAKGDYLFHEGEPTSGFYVVRSGAIHVHRVAPDGREKTIHIFRSGESFAEATLPDGAGYPAHACALEEGQVVFIPRTEFLDLLKRCPKPLKDSPTDITLDITLDVTKTALAAELRVRSETLSRVFAKMKSLGLFKTTGRNICVANPLGLQMWLAEGREA